MKNTGLLLAVLIAALLMSCSGEQTVSPRDVIPEKKMASLLLEIHLTDAILTTDLSQTDSKRNRALYFYPSLLEKHGVTKAQADSSIAWYMRHPDAYKRIYEQVIQELEKRQVPDAKPEPAE